MKKIKSTVALVLALIMAFSAFTCASAAPASASSDASIAKAVDTLAAITATADMRPSWWSPASTIRPHISMTRTTSPCSTRTANA